MNKVIEQWDIIVHEKPNDIVTVYEDRSYTYKEVDQLSDFYASKICNAASKVVGVMMSNSDTYIVAILAVLKCGKTFVPIDTMLPSERISHILNECSIELVLVDNAVFSEVNTIQVQMNDIPNHSQYEIIREENEIAYILYTSGTTGLPKGIKIGNQSVVNLVKWFDETYSISENPNVLQMASISFDVSIEEIFGCILNGGKLFIPRIGEKRHYKKLRDYIVSNNINIVQSVPIVLKNLLLDGEHMNCVKVVITGGEAIGDALKDKIIEKGYSLYNHYGPTETTVDCLAGKCKLNAQVTLGKPIRNCECFIVDENLNLVENGQFGELCCSGVNLSLGYVNSENDANRFVNILGKRAYRTGDYCCVNEEGEFVFGGRIDSQVKIRGRRIELEEINNTIMRINDVYNCVSIVVDDEYGGKIVAFYTGKERVSNEEINRIVSQYLPSYMIPHECVFLEEFELSFNSKIKVSELEKMYRQSKNASISDESLNFEEYTEEIKDVIDAIDGILKNEHKYINPQDSFEKMGMDSISYVKLIIGMEEKYNIETDESILDISRFNSIAEFGSYINSLRKGLS